MQKSYVFEAALVFLAIGLAGLLSYMIITDAPAGSDGWEISSNGSIDYMFVGSDDTLYTFSGNHIAAIGKDGRPRWSYDFAPEWRVLNDWPVAIFASKANPNYYDNMVGKYNSYPVTAEKDGFLYVFALHIGTIDEYSQYDRYIARSLLNNDVMVVSYPCEIIKLSPQGKAVWVYNFSCDLPDYYFMLTDPIAIDVDGDRVLVFHGNTQDVLDRDGRLLFSIANVTRQAAFDQSGHFYVVRAQKPQISLKNPYDTWAILDDTGALIGEDFYRLFNDPTYMVPTSIVDAYDSNGQLLWSKDIGYNATKYYVSQGEWSRYHSMPLYINNTLYVPINSGVATLSLDGELLWAHQVFGSYLLFDMMPFDERGNVYLKQLNIHEDPTYLVTIGPDGRENHDAWVYQQQDYGGPAGFYYGHETTVADDANSRAYLDSLYKYYQEMYSGPRPLAGNNGTVYAYDSYNVMDNETFDRIIVSGQFKEETITAYDVRTGIPCWNFTIPAVDRHVTTINLSNSREVLRDVPYSFGISIFGPQEQKDIMVSPGSNAVYLYYCYAIYGGPISDSESPCLYVNNLYAIDNDGKLLWSMPMNGHITGMVTGNNTIYYSTDNGRIGGNKADIAAGMAIAAMAYLFLRFFMVGTVARARSRLDKNANRTTVLRYIAGNPGATATDIARGLGVNIGTIRYHLLILTVNHKVVTYRADNKYLRYFTNAGTYTKEEQSLLSLMRREPLRQTLHAIAEKPGLSGPELAEKLHVSTTAAHRDITLLARRGLIEQVPGSDRGYGYTIRDEHREQVCRAMELLGCALDR